MRWRRARSGRRSFQPRSSLVAPVSRDRGGVDDGAALSDVRQRVLHHVKEAEDVGAERALDLRGLDLTNILGLVLLGDVVSPECRYARIYRVPCPRLTCRISPADVAGNQNRLASFTFHQFACLVGVLVFLEIDDRNLRALARHGARDGASDPAVSTRDERYFVF